MYIIYICIFTCICNNNICVYILTRFARIWRLTAPVKSHKVQFEAKHSSNQIDFEMDFEGKTSMVESAFEGKRSKLESAFEVKKKHARAVISSAQWPRSKLEQ